MATPSRSAAAWQLSRKDRVCDAGQGDVHVVEGEAGVAVGARAAAAVLREALGDDVTVRPELVDNLLRQNGAAVLIDDAEGASHRGLDLLGEALEAEVEGRRVVFALAQLSPGRGMAFAVVEQGGTHAEAVDLGDGVEAVLEGGEAEAAKLALLGRGEGLEGGSGDDAEGALGADEEAGEVGAGRAAADGASADEAAVGKSDLEREHLVAHAAVAAALVAEAVGADRAADAGDGEGPGVVAEDEAVLAQLARRHRRGWRRQPAQTKPSSARTSMVLRRAVSRTMLSVTVRAPPMSPVPAP